MHTSILPFDIVIAINNRQLTKLTHKHIMTKNLISKVSMSMSHVCVSIKVFCAERCDGSSLDSVLKIIPDARGRRTGRVCLQNQASTSSGQRAVSLAGPQPAVCSVCSLRVNTWPQPPLASLRLTNRVPSSL